MAKTKGKPPAVDLAATRAKWDGLRKKEATFKSLAATIEETRWSIAHDLWNAYFIDKMNCDQIAAAVGKDSATVGCWMRVWSGHGSFKARGLTFSQSHAEVRTGLKTSAERTHRREQRDVARTLKRASPSEKMQIVSELMQHKDVAAEVDEMLEEQRRSRAGLEDEPSYTKPDTDEDVEPDEADYDADEGDTEVDKDEEVTPPPPAKTKPAKPKAVKQPPPEPSPLEEALEDTEESLKRLRIILDRHSDDEHEEVLLKTQAKLKRFDIDVAHMAQTVKARLKKQRSPLRSVK